MTPNNPMDRQEVIDIWDDILARKGDKNYKGGDPLDEQNPPEQSGAPKPEKPKQ